MDFMIANEGLIHYFIYTVIPNAFSFNQRPIVALLSHWLCIKQNYRSYACNVYHIIDQAQVVQQTETHMDMRTHGGVA